MSVLFKNEEDRKNVPCLEYGKDVKIKVADLDELVKKLREARKSQGKEDVIEVKAIRTKREKELNCVIKFSKDATTGVHYGIVTGTYDDGNIRWRGIYLTDYNTFNLSNDYEAKCYIVLSMHPKMKGCPIPSTQEPEFEILDPDEIASRDLAEAMQLKNALHKIGIMPNDSVEPFARFLDIPVSSNMSTKYIKKLLTDYAKRSPADFINAYADRNRPLFEMVAMGRKHRIINYSTESGYNLGKTFLGYTKADAVRKLEDDELLLARLRSSLAEKDYNPENESESNLKEAEGTAEENEEKVEKKKPGRKKKSEEQSTEE